MGRDARRSPFNGFRRTSDAPSMARSFDRFGRELQVGDIVLLTAGAKSDIQWRVAKIGPSLHPQAPAGMLELHLIATLATGVEGGKTIADLIKVRDASELPSEAPTAVEEDPAAPSGIALTDVDDLPKESKPS
jgi:hypothetical protein